MSLPISSRERNLLLIVGGLVAVFLNLFLINFFLKNRARLQQELRSKAGQLAAMQALYSERDKWAQRADWLKDKQPKLVNQDLARGQLLEEVRELARLTNVQPLEPQLNEPEFRPHCTAVIVSIETRSTWPALRDFLYQMQKPDRFIVFESVNLQTDKEDKTQMHGKFRIAKWYAPR